MNEQESRTRLFILRQCIQFKIIDYPMQWRSRDFNLGGQLKFECPRIRRPALMQGIARILN